VTVLIAQGRSIRRITEIHYVTPRPRPAPARLRSRPRHQRCHGLAIDRRIFLAPAHNDANAMLHAVIMEHLKEMLAQLC
jgi:hypothetical protein